MEPKQVLAELREWLTTTDLALQMREAKADEDGDVRTAFFVAGERNMCNIVRLRVEQLEGKQ